MTTRREGQPRPLAVPRASSGGPQFRFFREVVSELRKVVWPSREEATRLTVMVITIAVAVGLALGLIDMGFSALVRQVFIG